VLGTTTPPSGEPDRRLVVTTLVSSSLLARIAADHGAHCIETFTGFKWIARTAREHPEYRLEFGYEQALGYLVGRRPLDKDGIGAAIAFTELVSVAHSQGRSVEDLLDDLASRFGRYVTAERSLRMDPATAAQVTQALRANPPTEVAGRGVVALEHYPEASLVRLVVGDSEHRVRLQIRPSGTEPKVKLYGEAVEEDPGPYLDALVALLDGSA